MTIVIQKGDLSSDFVNASTNNAGGISIVPASATVAGKTRFATPAEIAAGTATNIAIDPAGLASLGSGGSTPVATTTVQGKAALATPALGIAGTDNSTIVTPFVLDAVLTELNLNSRTRRFFYANF